MNVAEEERAPKRSKKENDGLMQTDKREKRKKRSTHSTKVGLGDSLF